MRQFTEDSDTLRIIVQPTNACNLACTYCYQTNKGARYIDVDKVKYFLDRLFEHDNKYFNGFLRESYRNVILDFMGGEATLAMKQINEIVDYFIKKCVEHNNLLWLHELYICLQTNGTTYFNEDVQAFIKKYNVRLELPITIDGNKSCHDECRVYHNGKGSYDDVEKAVKHYMSTYGKQPNTKITISPSNAKYTFDAIKNMIDLGYSGCRMSCTDNEKWTHQDDQNFVNGIRKFYEYIEENDIEFNLFPYSNLEQYEKGIRCPTCGACGNAINIAVDGKLFLCQSFSDICDMEGKPTLCIGDTDNGINNEGLRILETIKNNTRKVANTQGCKGCICNSVCEYCPAIDYAHYGSKGELFKTHCWQNLQCYELLKKHLEKLINRSKKNERKNYRNKACYTR